MVWDTFPVNLCVFAPWGAEFTHQFFEKQIASSDPSGSLCGDRLHPDGHSLSNYA